MDHTPNTQSPSLIKDLAFECVKRRTNNQALADRFIQKIVGKMDNDVLGELGIRRIN